MFLFFIKCVFVLVTLEHLQSREIKFSLFGFPPNWTLKVAFRWLMFVCLGLSLSCLPVSFGWLVAGGWWLVIGCWLLVVGLLIIGGWCGCHWWLLVTLR